MEQWTDEAILLSIRAHGENGAVASVLTETRGRQNGYIHGARSSKTRGLIQPGTFSDVAWSARTSDQLGTLTIDGGRNVAGFLLDDPLKLSALLSACALCDAALPERENHPALFYGLKALLNTLQTEVWAAAYIMWEIAFLKELGFGMDLTRCAANGDKNTLEYISPKSGCAVSKAAGEIYKDKLLKLPEFLKPNGRRDITDYDICLGLKMTGYFLEHWAFTHHSKGVPAERLRFESLFAKNCHRISESAA